MREKVYTLPNVIKLPRYQYYLYYVMYHKARSFCRILATIGGYSRWDFTLTFIW